MEKATIQQKSRDFAIRIINCYKYLTEEKKEFVMSKQLLRCGTSIGANRRPSERRAKLAWAFPSEKEEDEVNTRESKNAQSRTDFLSKLSIALKEADETAYWLDLLQATDYLDKKMFDSLNDDCTEIIKMLTAIIKTLKDK